MEQQNHATRSSDHLPIVIVCGDGQQGISPTYSQVRQALDRARIEHVLLRGNGRLSEMIHGQIALPGILPSKRSPVQFSVVAPVYNEEGNISELHRRLTSVLANLGEPYELVFVDDGSRDRSGDLLREMHARDPHVRVVSLARNFGQQQAVSAGLDQARGQAVIVMDGDLQDPPEVIPQFIEKWREGFQVVYAVREKRKEHIVKRIAYRSFYLILRAISRIDIPLEAGDFCLMDRCVVDAVTSLPERNRFVRGLRCWVGFRQVGLAYERDARLAGKPKYSFQKLVSLALDGLISFSYLPLRLSTVLGFSVSILSLFAVGFYLIKKLTTGLQPPGFATLVVLMLFLGGVQMITVGVVGEYIGHVLDEVKHRPTYVVREMMEQKSA